MKTFFVPVAGLNELKTIVATTNLAAQRFDGLIEGACVVPPIADYIALTDDAPWSRGEQIRWADRLQAEELAFSEAFAAALDARGIRKEAASGVGPRYRWHAGPLSGDYVVSQRARLFSATVVGRPA